MYIILLLTISSTYYGGCSLAIFCLPVSTLLFGAITEEICIGFIQPHFNIVRILIQVTHNKGMPSILKLPEEQILNQTNHQQKQQQNESTSVYGIEKETERKCIVRS